MERRYFFISLPNDNIIKALNVRLGYNVSDTYSLDGSVVYVKTTKDLISNSSDNFNSIFPPSLTEEVTLDEAITRLRSAEFTIELF